MSKYILIIIAVVFISCGTTSNDVKKYAQSIECYFKVSRKLEDKHFYFKGTDRNKKYVELEIGQFWDIYNSVEIGDTILKVKGETDFRLIKKDTILIFPLLFDGKIAE